MCWPPGLPTAPMVPAPARRAAIPPAVELLAVSDLQLELLFDAPAPTAAASGGRIVRNGAGSASQERSGIQPPPEATEHAAGVQSTAIHGIPARCPVVGTPVCYQGDCRHYQGGGCTHPEAVSRPQRTTLRARAR